MRDLIDERNFKEKCARSIVKGYNVHYITQEELDAQQLAKVEEIEKHRKGEDFVEELLEQQKEQQTEEVSAGYGELNEDDPVTREQIEKILGEREEHLLETIEENRIQTQLEEEIEV